MIDENLVSIDINELTRIISELESVNVEFDNSVVEDELKIINSNLLDIQELLAPEEVEKINSTALVDESVEEVEDLHLKQLEELNTNILALTEEIKLQNEPNELTDLQIKGHGSTIIILYLLVFFGLTKFVSFIFRFVSNNI